MAAVRNDILRILRQLFVRNMSASDADSASASLVDLEYSSNTDVLVKGDVYADRGDPSAVDFDIGDLTADNDWHDLDLSSIIAAGAKGNLVHLQIFGNGSGAARVVQLRENGNSNAINMWYRRFAAGVADGDAAWVLTDSAGKIEYLISGAMTTCNIVVRGWMIEAS